jgi:hypothetical protein
MKGALKLPPPNKAVELTAGSHPLAAVAHRQRSPLTPSQWRQPLRPEEAQPTDD